MASAGEMRLSGSITSAGGLAFSYGNTVDDYAEYFDTIPGRVLASTAFDQAILTGLQAGTMPQAIRDLLAANGLALGNSASVTSLANYTPFASLSAAARAAIAQSLGYTVFTSGGFYNPDSGVFVQNLVPSALTAADKALIAAAQGYT